MLKNTLLVFLFFFTFKSYACTCNYPLIPERFNNSEAVFKAKIVEVVSFYKNSKHAKRVKFNLIEDFKETVKSKYIDIDKPDFMCPIQNLQVGSTWLIFTNFLENGKLFLSVCNPSISFKKENTKIVEAKLKILKKVYQDFPNLKNLNLIKSDNTFRIYNPVKGRRYALSNKKFNKEYGLYYLTIDPVFSTVTDIEILKSLSSKDDKKILNVYNTKKIRNTQQFFEPFKIPIIIWKTEY